MTICPCVVTTVTTVTGDRWCWPATNISPSPAPGCGPGQIPTPSNSALTLSSPSPHTTGENQNHVHLFIQNSDIILSLPPSTLSYCPPGPMVGDHCPCGPWSSRMSCVHVPSILLHNAMAQMRLLISHIHTYYFCGLKHTNNIHLNSTKVIFLLLFTVPHTLTKTYSMNSLKTI